MDLTIQNLRISLTLTLDIYAVAKIPEFFVLVPFLIVMQLTTLGR